MAKTDPMPLLRRLLLLWFTAACLSISANARPNSGDRQYARGPREAHPAPQHFVVRRANVTSSTPINIPVQQTLSNIVATSSTPSSNTSAVPVTRQSQVVTNYIPQATFCELPPFPYSNVSNATYPATRGNASQSGTSSCSTLYSAFTTEICSTVLTGGGQLLTVTDCSQDVTFSTDHGYNLSSSTMFAPDSIIKKGTDTSVSMITTTFAVPTTMYYMAPWQDVATGIPTRVQAKICSSAADGGQDCMSFFEKWFVTMVQVVQTFTKTINLTTSLAGGTRVIIDETSTIDITNAMTTISISTEMPASSTVSLPSVSTIKESSPVTGPISTLTYTLDSVTSTQHTTITLHSTTTTYVTVQSTPLPTPIVPAQPLPAQSLPVQPMPA